MVDTSSSSGANAGQQDLPDSRSEINRHLYLVDQALADVRTHVPVKVIAVHGGGVGPPPTVDVQLLLKAQDVQGNTVSHGTIYGIPATRSQAGDAVIIADPVVGDIGTMAIHDRDISALKANNGQESNPGSFRRHRLADGVYHAQMLNQQTPKNYIQFIPGTGFKLVTSDNFNVNGVVIDKNGNISAPGNITAGAGTGDSVTLQKHVHPGTGQPTAGT